jgi:hypothetical protein
MKCIGEMHSQNVGPDLGMAKFSSPSFGNDLTTGFYPYIYIKHFEKIGFACLEWVDIRKLLALQVHRTC